MHLSVEFGDISMLSFWRSFFVLAKLCNVLISMLEMESKILYDELIGNLV